jgi:hypothetical protein
VVFNYEMQITKLEEEIERCRRMKLRIYEDLSDGVITKKEYADFRNQYTAMLDEKNATLERVRREKKDASVSGDTERAWVTLFRRYEGIDALTRRALMALVDKVFIYEKHGVEVSFKYGDEYRRATEFIGKNADLLPLAQ